MQCWQAGRLLAVVWCAIACRPYIIVENGQPKVLGRHLEELTQGYRCFVFALIQLIPQPLVNTVIICLYLTILTSLRQLLVFCYYSYFDNINQSTAAACVLLLQLALLCYHYCCHYQAVLNELIARLLASLCVCVQSYLSSRCPVGKTIRNDVPSDWRERPSVMISSAGAP